MHKLVVITTLHLVKFKCSVYLPLALEVSMSSNQSFLLGYYLLNYFYRPEIFWVTDVEVRPATNNSNSRTLQLNKETANRYSFSTIQQQPYNS